jgi:hypothetical protein
MTAFSVYMDGYRETIYKPSFPLKSYVLCEMNGSLMGDIYCDIQQTDKVESFLKILGERSNVHVSF